MSVTDGGITYGCSDELEDLAYGIAGAGRDLCRVLLNGGALPRSYTIKGVRFDVVRITGVTANGATNSQTALASALSASRGGTPTLVVLPPAPGYYRYSAELTLSANTYLVGYGAKIKPMTVHDTRINLSGSKAGMFGVSLHGLPDAMSKWPERFEFDNTTEAGKDGTIALGDSGSAHCWVQMSGGQDYILFDVETRGSLAGALRCYNAANVLVENCSATRTHSDSFHIVQGSSFATCRRLQIYDSGDDAISFIQYTNAPGGAQPRNMLIEECRLKGSRARGFTSVSGRDILWRNCKVEDVTLSGFLFGAKTAHSLSDCSGIKVRNCEAWRCGRMQAPNPNSGPFATLFSTSLYRCLNVEFTDCQAFVYGDDWYKTGFIRESDGFGGGGIQYSQTNCGVTVLDRAA